MFIFYLRCPHLCLMPHEQSQTQSIPAARHLFPLFSSVVVNRLSRILPSSSNGREEFSASMSSTSHNRRQVYTPISWQEKSDHLSLSNQFCEINVNARWFRCWSVNSRFVIVVVYIKHWRIIHYGGSCKWDDRVEQKHDYWNYGIQYQRKQVECQ